MTLKEYYFPYLDRLYNNLLFRQVILSYNVRYSLVDKNGNPKPIFKNKGQKELFKIILLRQLEEAEKTLSLLKKIDFSKKELLLEIGGGLGLTFGYLKKQNYKIFSLEPSRKEYQGNYLAAKQMFQIMKIPHGSWFPYAASQANRIKRRFKVIFSNNVLEHIPNLELTIKSLKSVLEDDGIMIHNTVNYLIPYEPHFRIFLFPFFPKFTALINKKLNRISSFKEINFINPIMLARLAKKYDLTIKFLSGTLAGALKRLETDKSFMFKHKNILPIYHLIKRFGLITIIKNLPPLISTPVEFTLEHNSSK
jgi:2-polyprenyl-3-methyl-5-hydroxy-6-metoxy-1,4-benzoquinol methylase